MTELVPATIDDIDVATLADLMGEALGGGHLTGFETEQVGEGVGMMGLLYRASLTVDGGDGTAPSSVIIKLAGSDPWARQTAKLFGWYAREVNFYATIAGDAVRTPQCHTALHDTESDDFVLVLEDLSHKRTVDQLDGCGIEDARSVITALARFGAAFWNDTDRVTGVPHIWESPNPEAFAHTMAESGPAFAEKFPGRLPAAVAAAVARMPEAAAEIFAPEAGQATTLMHGDFRLDNMFFDDDGVVLLDWQLMAKAGVGSDLGYFLSQSLTVDQRRAHEHELLDLYRETLAAHGAHIDATELYDSYRRAVMLLLAIPVGGGAKLDLANDRAVELLEVMLSRSLAAIEDLGALDTMP